MARILATVSGTALKPGVSLNRRYYSPEAIADAVRKAQVRLAEGSMPLTTKTHHAAEDDSTRIVGRIRSLTLAEDGSARFTADIADTEHGRTIATLLDSSGGAEPFLKGVSIRGFWEGRVRKVASPDGLGDAEQGDSLTLAGLDYTASPGVPGAGIDTFAWTDDGHKTETTERILITESVQEARVTLTEETEPPELAEAVVPGTIAEALEALLPVPHILDNGICVTCEASPPMSKRGSGLAGAGRVWADPGYQADKKQRYDLSTRANAKAGWAFVNQDDNAKKYTPAQLKRIKGKIKAALTRFGVKVAAESADWVHGMTYDAPVHVSEALAEHMGDSSRAGSWSLRASNGPIDICLSSYCMDPADLDVILRAAADAACKALAALDPDMDGDVDVPGVGDGSDPDNDAPGESAPEGAGTPDPDPAAAPAAATTEKEDPAMTTETTTPAAGTTPAIDQNVLAEAVATALAGHETARRARKAEKREKAERAANEAARIAAESAALGQGTPATAGATATETEDQRRARLRALVDEQFAAAASKEGLAAVKTDEQLVAEMLEEKLVPLRQERAEGGGVQRKGLAPLEAIADSPTAGKLLENATNEDLSHTAAAAYGPRKR